MPPDVLIPAPAADTRTALVEAATGFIQVRGFASFSFQDLADQIGIRKASIHYHFPSKSDLGLAVVAAMRDRLSIAWKQMEAVERVDERLRRWFDQVATMAECGRKICPIGSLQAEFLALPSEVQDSVRGFSREIATTYTRWLVEGRAKGQLRFAGDPTAMAGVLASVLQATLQRHRANPDESTTATLDQLHRLIVN